MNTSNKVHPRYSGLPETALNSEVMASKYAAEVSKQGNDEDKEYIIGAMEEWSTHFKEEGLTVADKHLAVLGEMSLILQNAGKGDFTGKIAVMIADMLKLSLSEGRATSLSVERLDLISDNFLRGIDKLMKVTETLISSTPRKQLKANRRTKSGPVIKPTTGIQEETISNHAAEDGTVDHDTPMVAEAVEVQGTPKDQKMTDNLPPPKGKAPEHSVELPDAAEVEALQAKVRTHYSDTEFESYPDKKKMALIYYYIETILGVSKSLVSQDANLRQMLFDIVDKRRVIRVCNLAKSGEFTVADMSESIEEAHDAIVACSNLYGNYASEIVTSGAVPVLVIIEIPI
uniref:Phosphoprotein n=1 Tax=Sambucus betanucleorhabdovirus 3 TaxID=3141831 RepID=A0AAU7E061_9RHAB